MQDDKTQDDRTPTEGENKAISEDYRLAAELTARALSGNHSKFEFIRSMDEYKVAKLYGKGVIKIISGYEAAAKDALKRCEANLREGKDSAIDLLNHRDFLRCAKFYRDELNLSERMICEYNDYVLQGHIMDTIMGVYRPEEDLYDHSDKYLPRIL